MAVRVLNLGSGSSGNALIIDDGATRLLVDCGLGPRTIASGLASLGLDWKSLDLVLISHEHIDHVRALPAVTRHDLPILCTPGTASAAGIGTGRFAPIDHSQQYAINSARITSIPTSHDAADPCGFRIDLAETSICVLTDTGELRDHFVDSLRGADLIVLEANHDGEMLRTGPYPAHLKRRVASRVGHLENSSAGELLRALLKTANQPPDVWLGHLSATNNRPDLALRTVRDVLGKSARDLSIDVLSRAYTAQLWTSGQRSVQLEMSLF